MICARCGTPEPGSSCSSCGQDPLLHGGRAYRLEEVIGGGAMGTTYRATTLDGTGDEVCVKELFLRRIAPKKEALFMREAEVLKQLSHPGIPGYFEHFMAGSGKHRALYIIEEYIAGQNLQVMLEDRRFTEDEVVQILDELKVIVGYLHGLSPPVVHRDIKPANVIRADDGRLVLVDFGTVRDAIKEGTLGGSTIAGTFGYMAPEQFRGVATPETDLYGMGALAAALLTRKEPHTLLDEDGRLGWARHAEVSDGTRRLLERLLATDPEDRVRDRPPPIELDIPQVPIAVDTRSHRNTTAAEDAAGCLASGTAITAWSAFIAVGVGIVSWVWFTEPDIPFASLFPPAPDIAILGPAPREKPVVAVPPAPRRAGTVVTTAEFVDWLDTRPDWDRGNALYGVAGRGSPHLRDPAIVGVKFDAARDYCADLGGLPLLSDPPHSWQRTPETVSALFAPPLEWRVTDALEPAVRTSDGFEKVGMPTTERDLATIGFRCGG